MVESLGAVLVVEQGIAEASVIPLDKKVHLLGKIPTADTTVDNPYVSRRHAEIRIVEGRYQIRDLGSKNGTFINGSPVGTDGQWLHNGDRIELGPSQVIMRFQTPSATMTLPSEDDASGPVFVDSRSRTVQLGDRTLEPPLSPREFNVLLLLYEKRGNACGRNEIAARAWPERAQGGVEEQEVEQCIRRIRLRLEPDPSQPRYILSAGRHGYKLAKD